MRGNFTPFVSKSFQIFPLLFPKGYENPKSLDIGLWKVGAKRCLNGVNKCKKSVNNLFCPGNFTPFMREIFQIWEHFFPLLFPKDSEKLNGLDIGRQEAGAKRPVNGVRNTDTKKSCSVRQNSPKTNFFVWQFYTLAKVQFTKLVNF